MGRGEKKRFTKDIDIIIDMLTSHTANDGTLTCPLQVTLCWADYILFGWHGRVALCVGTA